MVKCDIGIYGLGVMGQNLALNFSDKGYAVAVCNRRAAGEENVVNEFIFHKGRGKSIYPACCPEEFIKLLKTPRKILVMVKAGAAVDEVFSQLTPLLSQGDIVIDGGNSHFVDTARRGAVFAANGIHLVGCGISGGADGALKGPSLMPGGSLLAWDCIRDIFHSIAAISFDGRPCCNWIGPEGSGHFVKMVHNGAEYALMQLIAEVFDMMKRILMMDSDAIKAVIETWCQGELNSYLLDITADILACEDADGIRLLGKVLDCAEQKGTGKDIAAAAFDLGVPANAITEAINARFISALLDLRHTMAATYSSACSFTGDRHQLLQNLADALYSGQLIIFTQAFMVLSKASAVNGWNLSTADIAHTWSRGSIIRSEMLDLIADALNERGTDNLLNLSAFHGKIDLKQDGWRNVVICSVRHGIPTPVMSGTLVFFDSLRSTSLPANLIQAQRDYFGSHGYERIDTGRGEMFHMEWGRQIDKFV